MTALPATMTVIAIHGGKGDAEALHVQTAPMPQPRDGEILIRVRAAGVNRPDVFQRMGLYPPQPGESEVLGLEVAGEVVVPAGPWRVGDRVCALLGGGGYAEYAVCDARHALAVPAGLDMVGAASLPETLFTVFANVFEQGRLAPGETLLVHGANSGIGAMAIQLGKAAGAQVIATARGADKAAAAQALGADHAVDVAAAPFAPVVAAAGGADVVLDMIGGAYFADNLGCLNHGGRIVYIAALAGADITVPVLALMRKRATITGSTLRARSAAEKARLTAAIRDRVWPWIATGTVRPIIDHIFPLDQAAAAHRRIEAGGHFGKIMLRV